MKDKRDLLFRIVFSISILFILSPILLRTTCFKNIVQWLMEPLGNGEYKRSYMETVGTSIGTVLTIAATLMLQNKIDKKTEAEKIIIHQKEIEDKIVIVYYDFKLAFEDIARIYKLLFIAAFLVDKNKINTFYDSIKGIELYVDERWIRNVASLHEVLEDEMTEEIFLIYGDICSIKNGLKSNDRSDFQALRLSNIVSKFYDGYDEDIPKLKKKYQEILNLLREKGNIKRG